MTRWPAQAYAMATILVNIDVPELEPAIAYYTRAFDLTLARRLGSDFAVQDIDAALARALAAGARQESEISEHAYGRLVLLSDPFGHGACLLQFNERGYDAIATPG